MTDTIDKRLANVDQNIADLKRHTVVLQKQIVELVRANRTLQSKINNQEAQLQDLVYSIRKGQGG